MGTLAVLNHKQKRQAAACIVMMGVNAILEVFSLVLILTAILGWLQEGVSFAGADSILLGSIFTSLTQDLPSFLVIGLILLIFILKNLLSGFFAHYYTSFGFRVAQHQSESAYEHFFSLDYLAFTEVNSAVIAKQSYYSPNEFANSVLSPLLLLLSEFMVVLTLAVAVFFYQWRLLFLILGLFVPLCLLVIHLAHRRTQGLNPYMHDLFNENLVRLSQGIDYFVPSKLNRLNRFFIRRFQQTNGELFNLYKTSNLFRSFAPKVMEIILVLTALACLLFALKYKEELNLLETMGVLVLAAYKLLPAVNRILTYSAQLRMHGHVLSDMIPATEFQQVREMPPTEPIAFQALQLQKISFSFQEKETLLSQVSLTMKRGDCVGICGKSGSGKSTLCLMMMGLIKPKSGRLLINQAPLDPDRMLSWQDAISYVPQSPLILDMSLRENLSLGCTRVERKGIMSVLDRLDLTAWYQTLPDGLETQLGENGIKISGGQRQRLALARVIFQDKPFWVLDEITNQLDTKTERAILNVLIDELNKGRSMVIVSHGDSLLEVCHRIYRLDDGRLVLVEDQ